MNCRVSSFIRKAELGGCCSLRVRELGMFVTFLSSISLSVLDFWTLKFGREIIFGICL